MKDFLAKLREIPNKLINVLNFFLDGIGKQVSTVKGSMVMAIAGLFLLDIMAKGTIGIIQFCLDQCKELIDIVAKTGGWQIVVLALILLLWKKDSK